MKISTDLNFKNSNLYLSTYHKNVAMNNDCSTSDRIEDTQETGQVYFPVCGNYKKKISYYTIQ